MDSSAQQREQYEEVIKLIGSDVEKHKNELEEAYGSLGSYYLIRKDYGQAADYFRKAIRLNPGNSRTHLGLGQAIVATVDPQNEEEKGRKTTEAIAQFRESIRLNPNDPQPYIWLAQTLILSRVEGENEKNAQKLEEARKAMHTVLKLDPNNPDAKKFFQLWGK